VSNATLRLISSLLKFRRTPTGRIKTETTDNVSVSTGASERNPDGKWKFIDIAVRVDDKGGTVYYIRMDRDTAARVARTLAEYLASDVPSGAA
jgi:hypothetical protein